MSDPLTSIEREIVDLLEEGYQRWKIAEIMGLGDTTVRSIIKRLCERYQCSMRELPGRVREEQGDNGQPEGA